MYCSTLRQRNRASCILIVFRGSRPLKELHVGHVRRVAGLYTKGKARNPQLASGEPECRGLTLGNLCPIVDPGRLEFHEFYDKI